MKRRTNFQLLSLLVLVLIGFNACNNKDVDIDTFKIERERVVPSMDSVSITGSYSFVGTVEGMKVYIGEKQSLIDANSYDMHLEGTAFSTNIGGLKPSTKYYYRFSVDFGKSDAFLTETKNFITLAVVTQSPTVRTIEVLAIDSTTFRVDCKVESDGGMEVTERGVCWNTYGNPNLDDSITPYPTPGEGEYSCKLPNLAPNTKYYVRAYAKNPTGLGFGEELMFKTGVNISLPQVSTVEISLVTYNSAICLGNVASNGGLELTERGVCWGLEPDPTVNVHHAIAESTTTGNFTVGINGLAPNTTYHVRCYATNEIGTTYGQELTFTTTEGLPTVNTSAITNITATSAKGGGEVTDEGASSVTERGICWGTNHNPSLSGNHASSGTGSGPFTVSMTDLTAGLTYYVRAYATNTQGTSYGAETEFSAMEGLPIVQTLEVTDVTSTTAKAHGKVTEQGETVTEQGVCWGLEPSPTISGHHATSSTGTGEFTVNLNNLTPGTQYFVRAYAKNEQGIVYGEQKAFTTEATIPTVVTGSIDGSTVSGNVTDDGGATVTERGICWGTNHNPNIANHHGSSGTGTGSFSVELTDLEPGTTYYVRAYATNSIGTAYGNEKSFTTAANLPSVTTGEVSNITQNSAQGSGNVTESGGATVTERGVCWSTGHNPTVNGSNTNNGTGTGTFTSNITGLRPNTTYYVRAYATNSAGTKYGNEVSFTTSSQNVSAPTVTTAQVGSITQNSATGGGNVTSDGGANVTERGVCWGTNHNPTTSGNHTNNGTGTGSFNCTMNGLSGGTTYYVRAYAINSQGTSYGNEVSFTTPSSLPTVTTSQVTNITQNSASGGGNVTNEGGLPVTVRGICWSTNHNPTISNSHQGGGSGTGNFNCNMTSLSPNTTYYVRAYATNSAGTQYGNEVSFSTTGSLPTVTTSQVTNITQTTATGGGNVTDAGGSNVTDRGICWSTSHNPTISNNTCPGGAGVGAYSALITDLTANTTYYVRAYATNSAGTAYGSEVSFTTLPNLPTVTTSQVTNISQNSATGGGNVTATGGANVTERGICWSTSHNPTTGNGHANGGSGNGAFTCDISGLSANTTYYVRAYAINGGGTAYGDEVSFVTLPNLPTVSNVQISSIAQTSATATANVTSGINVTERGVCWSTSPSPTTSGSHASSGSGTGSFSVNMTGLTAGTTYYVRAYAINSSGIKYGAEANFTTIQPTPTGAINGLFSVSATQQVWFSQGNLQYQASTNTWRFATNQYDYIGNGNANISQTYSGWIDLFGWGTSGWNSGNTYYHPWDSDNSDGTLYGPPGSFPLTGEYANADWGVYNPITNGGNQANSGWRTISYWEWIYVLDTRATSSGIRYAKARVNSIDGLILLPDNWDSASYTLNSTNSPTAPFTSNIINYSNWLNVLEVNGAVFLPISGARNGTAIFVTTHGCYWTSTQSGYGGNHDYASDYYFTDENLGVASAYKYSGYAVRLVRPVQ